MATRGPKRMVAADQVVALKRSKVDVEVKVEKMDEAKIQHTCPICSMELECAPGDMVMKRHYMENHFTSGGLLEMVALDLAEGDKLRCPYPNCQVICIGALSQKYILLL